ncbi:MAG: hypothetical protein ABIF19_02890 [Planctomycetota bacterium]
MFERGKSRKLRGVEILVVVSLCLFLLAIIGPVSKRCRAFAWRTKCGNNLSVIGKGTLAYANDHDGELPRSGGGNTVLAPSIPDWLATDRSGAYGLQPDGSRGQGSISSCFYLLVKYQAVTPGRFVCPADAGTTEFNPDDEAAGDRELVHLWDFGPFGGKHCSYSYHVPFGLYALTTSNEPGMAVAADRSPWRASPDVPVKELRLSDRHGDRETEKAWNSITHQENGQNVLFLDGHVAFERNPFCGVNNDNIYTFWDGGDIRRGGLPNLSSRPQSRTDSLLVHDHPRPPHNPPPPMRDGDL